MGDYLGLVGFDCGWDGVVGVCVGWCVGCC